jgi:hypothetical protein
VKRPSVAGGYDRDRCDPELPARPKDTERDLTAVGDEELVDWHGAELYGAVAVTELLI